MKLMDILIEMVSQQDEIATKTKEPYSWGAHHYIYKTNDPTKLIKVGSPETVNEWFDLFNNNPNVFAKVYKKGVVKVNTGQFGPRDAHYVLIEKLDTRSFKSLWHQFGIAVKEHETKIGLHDHNSLQYYITRIEDDMDFIYGVAKSLEHIVILHNRFVEFVNLLLDIYELKPAADIHVDQFGIDGQGKIKCFDV